MAARDRSRKPGKRGMLVRIALDQQKEVIKLRRDATIFGREKADIIVDDKEVSSTHCQIQNINESYHIFDMNSSNGTFVNNQRIVKARLQPGDVVTLGQTSWEFRLEEAEKVRHITTLFQPLNQGQQRSSIVDTMIDKEAWEEKEPRIVLRVVYGDGSKETIELHERSIAIGRASHFGRFDQDPELSRRHLKVKLNNEGDIFGEDMGSTNGTWLNSRRMKGLHKVEPGDEIRAGLCRIRVRAAI